MNFFQKITGLITLICAAMTLSILFVCFVSPFSVILLTEISALIFSEIVLGGIGIWLFGRKDQHLPYSISLWLPGVLYFCFVLIMIYPAECGVAPRNFILSHSLGAGIFLIGVLIFLLGRRSLKETGDAANSGMQNKEIIRKKMAAVQLIFCDAHPQEKELAAEGEKMLDSFRFASVSADSSSEYDLQLIEKLDNLKILAALSSVDEYRKKLQDISKLFHLRERI